jgi:hypothetical protein
MALRRPPCRRSHERHAGGTVGDTATSGVKPAEMARRKRIQHPTPMQGVAGGRRMMMYHTSSLTTCPDRLWGQWSRGCSRTRVATLRRTDVPAPARLCYSCIYITRFMPGLQPGGLSIVWPLCYDPGNRAVLDGSGAIALWSGKTVPYDWLSEPLDDLTRY